LRHKVEIDAMTGRIVECPIDEMYEPRGRKQAARRISPTEGEVKQLFTGWPQELVTCRKFLVSLAGGRRLVDNDILTEHELR
jgi:integrase/recombinase XerD